MRQSRSRGSLAIGLPGAHELETGPRDDALAIWTQKSKI